MGDEGSGPVVNSLKIIVENIEQNNYSQIGVTASMKFREMVISPAGTSVFTEKKVYGTYMGEPAAQCSAKLTPLDVAGALEFLVERIRENFEPEPNADS